MDFSDTDIDELIEVSDFVERTCVCGHPEFKCHPDSFASEESGQCIGTIGTEKCTCLGFRIRRGKRSQVAKVASTSPPRCRQAVRSQGGQVVHICNTRLTPKGECNGEEFHIT